ncbi:MAG: PIN domain-containing protein [Sterolibacterium sp.]|nr:PIN domain-containing protein [Sterolibacterium sp.]
MKRYLLDTSALFALRDDEAGADRVAELLALAGRSKVSCQGCFITLMEILYRVWKDEGEHAGRLAYEQCQSLPIEWIHETAELLKRAAAIKAGNRLSLADAWIAASAELSGGILVHRNSEFESLELAQEALPYTSTNIGDS